MSVKSQAVGTCWILGESLERRPFECFVFAPSEGSESVPTAPSVAAWPWLIILGGVHGDETEGVWLLEETLRNWCKTFPGGHLGAIVWPRVNPDGYERHQRWNAAHIDLNRNLPTKDWTSLIDNPRYQPGPRPASEPETRALVALIEACKPVAILSVHSYSKYQVNSNGPARPWAEELGKLCRYPVTEDIGYPTPGSLGTYAGSERQIPTVTLEIERGISRETVLRLHLPVVERTIQYWDEKEGKK